MRNLILFCLLVISINAYAQQPPVANSENYSVDEDSSLTVTTPGVLDNDYDPDGDPIISAILESGTLNGDLELNTDGSFTYSPFTNFNGADSFSYTAESLVIPSEQTFTVDQIKSVLHVDMVVNYSGFILADSDNSSFTGTITADLTNNLNEFSQIQINEMNLLLVDDLNFTLNFFGSGVNINIPSETVQIEMKIPGPPTSVVDGLFTQTGNTIGMTGTLNVAGFGIFESIIPDTTLNLSEDVSADVSGTIAIEDLMLNLNIPINISAGDTTNFDGIDISFAITINDTVFSDAALVTESSDPATVLLTVNPVNDAPEFISQPVTEATQDVLYSYNIGATDIDDDSLWFSMESGPSWLSLDDYGDGTALLSGVPTNADVGDHDVTIQVSDSKENVTQSFLITVDNINDPPVVEDVSDSTLENSSVDILLAATDIDDDTLSFSVVSGPSNGTVVINDSVATYTPELYFCGTNTFTYNATDGKAVSNEATVTVKVIPVNDPPSQAVIINPPNKASIVVEDDSDSLFVVEWESATDPEGDEITYTWQLAASTEFSDLLKNEDVGPATSFETGFDAIALLLAGIGIMPGDSIKLYHRVVSSDGEFEIDGEAKSITFIRDSETGVFSYHSLPKQFKLAQNYPNPFNPTTRIPYALPSRSRVLLKVYDAYGREVRTLVNEVKPAGYYEVTFDAGSLPSGLYVYRIEAREYKDMKKLILIK